MKEGGTDRFREEMIYGEGAANDKARNLRGQVFEIYDGAGKCLMKDKLL